MQCCLEFSLLQILLLKIKTRNIGIYHNKHLVIYDSYTHISVFPDSLLGK